MKSIAAVMLGLLMLATPVSAASRRFQSYQKWVKHYQTLMGLEQTNLIFVHYHHPNYCAWVARADKDSYFDDPVFVGLSEPDWECMSIPPRVLALHEMCHLRMQHLARGLMLSDKVKHDEVAKCMKAYEERDRDAQER